MKLTKFLPVVALLTLSCGSTLSEGQTHKLSFTAHPIKKTHLLYEKLTSKVVKVDDRKTFDKRKNIAKKIELRFRKRGINDKRAIVGAWVNAWHESEFNPKDEYYGCKGLFQLLSDHSDHWLYNADRNIDILLNEEPYKPRIDKWYIWVKKHPHASVREVTVKFATDVERCAKRFRARRGITASHWMKVINSES